MPIRALLLALLALCTAALAQLPPPPLDGVVTLSLDKALPDGKPLSLQINLRAGTGETGWVLAAPASYDFGASVVATGLNFGERGLTGAAGVTQQPAPVDLGALPVPDATVYTLTLDLRGEGGTLTGTYTGTRGQDAITGVATGTWQSWPATDTTGATPQGRPGKGKAWGYLGDGSGILDAKPPLMVDAANPTWKTELPAYGHATPIVVGDRVFVTCEPSSECPWPQLLCLDAKDGTVLWRDQLNHLPAVALPDKAKAEAAQLWRTFWQKYYKAQAIRGEMRTDPTKKDALQKQVDELGAKGDIGVGGYWSMRFAEYTLLNGKYAPYKAATLTQDTWSTMGNIGSWNVGEAFATPTSDGTYVYATTAMGGFFCFTLDGTLRWMKHYPGQLGEYCRNGRSPILYKDLLISDITAQVRAIDAKTGELKWSAPVDNETIMTPTVITTGGTDILLCFNRRAFRLPDGKPLTIEGGSDFGGTTLTKYDEPDVVFCTGGGEHGGWQNKGNPPCPTPPPACVRYTLDGDTLKGTVLWCGINGKPAGECHTGIIYDDGKLYHKNGNILEASTGTVAMRAVSKTGAGNPVPATGHLLYSADGHIFGLRQESPDRNGRGTTQLHYIVCTLDGKVVSNTTVPGFTHASAFALAGDCVYVRTSSHLWCLK